MNKTIKNNLILIGIALLVFCFSNTAFARVTCDDCDDTPFVTINNANPATVTSSESTFESLSSTVSAKKSTTATKTTTTKTVAVASTPIAQKSTSSSALTANSYSALSWFGAPGFLPNTVFEWFLTFLLILILIILIRQFRPAVVHEAHPTAVHH